MVAFGRFRKRNKKNLEEHKSTAVCGLGACVLFSYRSFGLPADQSPFQSVRGNDPFWFSGRDSAAVSWFQSFISEPLGSLLFSTNDRAFAALDVLFDGELDLEIQYEQLPQKPFESPDPAAA